MYANDQQQQQQQAAPPAGYNYQQQQYPPAPGYNYQQEQPVVSVDVPEQTWAHKVALYHNPALGIGVVILLINCGCACASGLGVITFLTILRLVLASVAVVATFMVVGNVGEICRGPRPLYGGTGSEKIWPFVAMGTSLVLWILSFSFSMYAVSKGGAALFESGLASTSWFFDLLFVFAPALSIFIGLLFAYIYERSAKTEPLQQPMTAPQPGYGTV
ncbi:unnamed protein product [Amoebophrya sp. A25]|nr:unnamed protein product [Amoebophrya sp. A25]|eukprot:GSA25T00001053001.1